MTSKENVKEERLKTLSDKICFVCLFRPRRNSGVFLPQICNMENFKKQYRDLEMKVMRELRNKVECSKHISKHVNEKAIKVKLYQYTELTIVNDKLTFLDKNGLQFSLFVNSIEDLIDILDSKL